MKIKNTEILEELGDGKKLRRNSWKKGAYMSKGSFPYVWVDDIIKRVVSFEELTIEGWELFEDPKKTLFDEKVENFVGGYSYHHTNLKEALKKLTTNFKHRTPFAGNEVVEKVKEYFGDDLVCDL